MAKFFKKRRGQIVKKYSAEEKFRYHASRSVSCGKHGIKYGSPSHCYSDGFCEAFHSRNNTSGVTSQFGKKSGNAYSLGYKRGRKAMWEYIKTTGKDPYTLSKYQ